MTNSSSENLFAGVLKNAKAEPAVATPKTEPAKQPEAGAAPATAAAEPETNDDTSSDLSMPTELDMLKNRARLMGISFSNNIGVDALKAKIQEKLNGEAVKDEPASVTTADNTPNDVPQVNVAGPAPAGPTPSKPKSLRQLLHDREMKLVRLRITNLDPKKKDLPGEILTVANEVLGTVKKYIPYGEATDNGYHVPYCLYKQLRDREFLNIKTRKNSRGLTIVETSMAREFALEILPPLTEKELAQLAAAQAAAKGMD